jgi:hypothetical protein
MLLVVPSTYRARRLVFFSCMICLRFSIKIPCSSLTYSNYVFTSLVILITLLMLLIKWIIIRSVHDAKIHLYHSNQSSLKISTKFCQKIYYQNLNIIMFAITCSLTIILGLPHKKCLKQKCNILFGSLVPVDFFTDTDRKLIAAVFALCADQLREVLRDTLRDSSSSDVGVVVSYLQEIFRVCMMGLQYYPILVAIYMDSLGSLILSNFYILIEFAMRMTTRAICPTNHPLTVLDSIEKYRYELLIYYGTGSFLILIELLIDTPRFLCLSYIIVKLIQKITQKVRHHSKVHPSTCLDNQTRAEKMLLHVISSDSTELRYIHNLLKSKEKNNKDISSNRWFYEWRDDFRYSSRILSVYSSICLFFYAIVIEICICMPIIFTRFQTLLQILIALRTDERTILPKHFLLRSFFIAFALGLTIVVIQLFLLLMSIRRNLLQAYRGHYSEISPRDPSTYVNHAIANFHFSGYLMAYALWSLVLLVICIFVALLFVDMMILYYGIHFIASFLTSSIPFILLVYFKDYLNKILARFVFLQEAGGVLAIQNRPILMIFLYFNFYVDALLGFLSSFMRLGRSVIGGIIYMGRLDYSPLGRKLETHDDGFGAYCGFIHTECTHRHPILLVFAAHLLEQEKKRQMRIWIRNQLNENPDPLSNHVRMEIKRQSRFIRKWHLLVLLLRNPSLTTKRKIRKNND